MARLLRMIRIRFESLRNSSDSSRKQIFRDILKNFSYHENNIYKKMKQNTSKLVRFVFMV